MALAFIFAGMRKDIAIPEVKNVFVAAVKELNEQNEVQWWIYLINDTNGPLENLIVNSRGYADLDTRGGRQTSTLRKNIKVIPAKSAARLEPIMEDTFDLFNEYWVMFFENGTMKDRKFIFGPYVIDEGVSETLPVLNKKGVLVK